MSINPNNSKTSNSTETIITFCAHNDDQLLGAGGTLIKYNQEGKKIITYIFSYGETSHFHYKREVTVKMRVQESTEAAKILGEHSVLYFGLKEGKFDKEIIEKNLKEKVKEIIKKNSPSKIFTHSIDDPHPDHKSVYNLITGILDEINYKGDAYSFDIWNPINIRRRDCPKLFVDISDTFNMKLKAFDKHKSQTMTKITLLWSIYVKAIINGWNNHCKYAEVFYKIW